MPNHICNIVKFKGNSEVVKHLMGKIAGTEEEQIGETIGLGTIDFNKIIPEPQYKDDDEWYKWRIEHWGTKWNAYEQKKSDKSNELYFWTAWRTPLKVFQAIAKKFPSIAIEVNYADEDTGNNCGTLIFEKGELVAELKTEYSDYSRKFAKKVWKKYDTLD